MLHALGLKMGDGAAQPKPWKVHNAFAAPGLDTLCEGFYSQPWWREKTNFEHRRAQLRWWASQRCSNNEGKSEWIGGTHPTFCLMAKELSRAWLRPAAIMVKPWSAEPNAPEGWKQWQHQRMSQAITEFAAGDFARVVQVESPVLESVRPFLDDLTRSLSLQPTADQFHGAEDLLRRAFEEQFVAIP